MEDSKHHRTNNLSIQELAAEDRPREKLKLRGKKELSNAELLAILIGSGSVGQSAVGLAQEILAKNSNDLSTLSRQSIGDLSKGFRGMGEAKAITIIAAMELGYRMVNEAKTKKDEFITDSQKLFDIINDQIYNLDHEEFWAVYMNVRRKVLHKQRISIGGLNETTVDLRRLYALALEHNATCIAVAHNHPAGSLSPSSKDIALTRKIKEAGQLLGIALCDHIIVGVDDDNRINYYSFFDHGSL